MFEVVGLRNVKFEDQRTGQSVDGLRVYCMCEDDNTEGVMTETFFFGRNKFGNVFSNFKIGGHFRVLYNKYGKPDEIDFID